jgi:hypothetical protein
VVVLCNGQEDSDDKLWIGMILRLSMVTVSVTRSWITHHEV